MIWGQQDNPTASLFRARHGNRANRILFQIALVFIRVHSWLSPNSPLSPSMGTTKCGGGQKNFSKNRSSGKIRGQNRGNS